MTMFEKTNKENGNVCKETDVQYCFYCSLLFFVSRENKCVLDSDLGVALLTYLINGFINQLWPNDTI